MQVIRRLNAWLDASLGNRMAWAAGTLALGFATILTILAFLSIGALLFRQLDFGVRSQADVDAGVGANALSAAVERVRELAGHSMVINGLVDSAGRQSYLVPFIEQQPFHARLDGALAICDPVGDTIAAVGSQLNRERCAQIRPDATGQMLSSEQLTVVQVGGEIYLDVREPIHMAATGSIEGLVVGRVSARRVLEDAGIWTHSTLMGMELGGKRQLKVAGDTASDGSLYRVESVAPLRAARPPQMLSLSLSHGVATAPLYRPVGVIVFAFVTVLLTIVLLVTYLARRQANRLSVPLMSLKAASLRAADGRPIELEPALIRPDEIGTLAASVKRMADTLQHQGDVLESEVERRTKQLVAAKDASERANAELQTFAYTVAHDLKAPLRGIDGYSSLLLDRHSAALDDEGRRCLAAVRLATVNMGQLIDDLLAYSRIEQRQFATSEIAIGPMISALVEERKDELRQVGARVDVLLAGDPKLNGDSEGLKLVFRNLLGNAIKFSRSGIEPTIEIGCRESAVCHQIWVRDNGVGFDMRFHDRIFAIFQRLHRTEDYPGTGVGLAIVRKAVERMRGRVWAESSLGEGATFFVELPR